MTYLNGFLNLITNLIYSYGYLGVIIGAGIEYTVLPAPPSEVIIPLIGAMASDGYFNIFFVYFIVVLSGVVGSITSYYIGYFLGRPIINFIERKIPKTKKPLHKVNLLFNKYSYLSVCIGRLMPFTRTYISLVAGVEKINIFKFSIFTAIGIGIWDLILILSGYFVGSNISFIEVYFKNNIYAISSVVILMIIVFVIYLFFKKRKNKFL